MADFTAYQDVQCFYPISGQYGTGPRVLYYALLTFVIILRQQTWLAAGAAAYCLVYGGSAAIHALILAPIQAQGYPHVPNGVVQLPNSTKISLRPVVPDLDSDATLAVVGIGFLTVIPMALWSAHFRNSSAVPILVLWILLMFIGMISCMAIFYGVDGLYTSSLKEWRFCSPGYNDSMPLSGNPTTIFNGSWNDTIWRYFLAQKSQSQSCFYPCLNANELLRSQGDIHVVSFINRETSNPLQRVQFMISLAMSGCVPISILSCIAILILRFQKCRTWTPPTHFILKSHQFLEWSIDIYARILIPVVLAIYLVGIEWVIWYDPQSESMQMVGQWAPLVGAALVFISAVVGKYWEDILGLWEKFWRRRAEVKRGGKDEKIWRSVIYAWKERKAHSRAAWSQAGTMFFQGV